MEKVQSRLKSAFDRANRATGGVLGIVRDTVRSFGEARAAQSAAGMAYYTLFSLFPLLLVAISIGALFLEREELYQQVTTFVSDAIPVSRSLINDNLKQVLENRGPVGVIGLVGALWSASGAFGVLANNVNLAWPGSKPRGFFRARLVALAMVAVLILFVTLSTVSTTAISLIEGLDIPIIQRFLEAQQLLWDLGSELVPWVISFVMFLALYRWVPNARVRWEWAAIGAAVAAVAWQFAINVFAWYVSSGLASYNVVYGSLGRLVALLFWIYLSSWIMLFGAHLSAVLAKRSSAHGHEPVAKFFQ